MLSWLGSTGQPGCQLPPSCAAVTGNTDEEKGGGAVVVVGKLPVGAGTAVVELVEDVDTEWRAEGLAAEAQPAKAASSSAIAMTPAACAPLLPAVTSTQRTGRLRRASHLDVLAVVLGRRIAHQIRRL
jgi:hypothetical protein